MAHKLFSIGVLTFLFNILFIVAPSAWGAVGELKQGRYIGTIELEPSKSKISVVSDFFLESPEDLTKFPSLHASLKLTLGGYNTHEYITEIFDEIRYDFENGILTLDDPGNDIVLTAEVKSVSGNTHLVGDVFIRSAAVLGKITLIYETDEPEDDFSSDNSFDAGEFIPLLDGQYEGLCGEEQSVIQLQTVRGLKTQWQTENETSSLTRYYGVTARIGVKNSIACGDLKPGTSCTYFNYGGGSYSFYTGKLLLHGPSGTDECTIKNDTLNCQIRRSGWNKDCAFKKNALPIKAVKFFTRRYNLTASAAQLKELPPANPPKNTELSAAVRGTFAGYLHNETNDTYQYIQLTVLPFSFTENPHNPNQMMISSTATLHLGKDASGPFITQRFEPRSFYIRPGFTLAGPKTDTFINIKEWKQGFIRAEMYSHAFGRIGTVQLIKSIPPAPPAGMELVRSFVGEFDGPIDDNGFSAKMRWFKFLFPAQPNDLSDNLIRFSGSYNPVIGVMPPRNIERATFDPFTGSFGWIIEKDGAATFANGSVDKDNNVRMYWPPAPGVWGTYMNDYVQEKFKRK